MVNWYNRTVIPRWLNAEMGAEGFMPERRATVEGARGIVLEVGVGPGYNLALYKNVTKLYALEPSSELVEIAKGRAGGLAYPVEFIVAGAEKIPLPDHSVDTVVSTWTLCSVRDPLLALREIKRVLKPGGTFTFAEHGASPGGGTRLLQSTLTLVSKYFTGNCHWDRNFDELLKQAGFTIQRMEHPPEPGRPLVYNYDGIAT